MAKKNSNFLKHNWQSLTIFVVFIILSIVLFNQLIPRAKPLMDSTNVNTVSRLNDSLNIVAIGDSLTEGVGDSTNSGGYVPLLAVELKNTYQFGTVITNNYGKSGNRTTQVSSRIEESKQIQKNLADADIVVITVGANDLMKVVKENFLNNLSIETFKNPKEDYIKNLTTMYQLIRSCNAECPIYHLGIYNPFYLNFQEITEMQDIVNLWNDATISFIDSQKKSYFVPINEQIYKGNGFTSNSNSINNLLSEEDSFHPNNIGYQIIANAFQEKMAETVDDWLIKK